MAAVAESEQRRKKVITFTLVLLRGLCSEELRLLFEWER
jgi:hypothetical protein